jgi:hypothetical protein
MTAAAKILGLAEKVGVRLRAENGKIIARPKALVNESLVQLIRANKSALLNALTADVVDVAHVAHAAGDGHEDHPGVEALLRYGPEYTPADLDEMDRLLREIARLDHWPPSRLERMLDERRRMAPINVPAALRLLRAEFAKAALDPEKPTKRAPVVLCVIKGGKA